MENLEIRVDIEPELVDLELPTEEQFIIEHLPEPFVDDSAMIKEAEPLEDTSTVE